MRLCLTNTLQICFSCNSQKILFSFATCTQRVPNTFSVGRCSLQRWSSALEGWYSAHVDPWLPICSWRGIWPLPRIVRLPRVSVWMSVQTVSRFGHQHLSGRRFFWNHWRTVYRFCPLQGNRAHWDVTDGAVILAICYKETTQWLKQYVQDKEKKHWKCRENVLKVTYNNIAL